MKQLLTLPADQHHAVEILRSSGVLVFPTETVYGVGALIDRKEGLEKLAQIKQRPTTQPISVLVSGLEMALPLWVLSPVQQRILSDLGRRYWPGPLTLIAPCRVGISPILTGGTGTLGVRVPQNALLCEMIQALGGPLAAASANRAGEPPATNLAEASSVFANAVDGMIAGEESLIGHASTVAQLIDQRLKIHREGAILESELQTAMRSLTKMHEINGQD